MSEVPDLPAGIPLAQDARGEALRNRKSIWTAIEHAITAARADGRLEAVVDMGRCADVREADIADIQLALFYRGGYDVTLDHNNGRGPTKLCIGFWRERPPCLPRTRAEDAAFAEAQSAAVVDRDGAAGEGP